MGEIGPSRGECIQFPRKELYSTLINEEKHELEERRNKIRKRRRSLIYYEQKARYENAISLLSDAFQKECLKYSNREIDKESFDSVLSKINGTVRKLSCNSERYEATLEAEHGQFNRFEAKVKEFTCKYKYVVEDYFFKLDKILKSMSEVLQSIKQATNQFRVLSKATAYGNFIFWISEICTIPIALRYFRNPKTVFILSTVAGSVSICGSLFAFSYAKSCIQDISKHLTQNRNEILNLESIFRMGNSTDEAVRRLFPHGINEELVDQIVLEEDKYFESEHSWKQSLYFLILLSNMEYDENLLEDDEFLMSVKIFVESPASRTWWMRMKIRRLMGTFLKGESYYATQQLVSCKEVFQNRAASSLLPVTASLIFKSGYQDKIRVILSGVGTTMAAFEMVDSKEHEFEELRRLEQILKQEYRKLEKIWIAINTEYD